MSICPSALSLAVALAVLAAAGLANALYFTLLYYHAVPPDSRWAPSFCRLADDVCDLVVFSRSGRVFGVPNSLPGLFFYVLVLYVGLSRITTGQFHYAQYALAGAGAAMALGVYLVYALLVKLKAP